MEFTVGKRERGSAAVEIVKDAQSIIGFQEVAVDEDVAKVSVIGVGTPKPRTPASPRPCSRPWPTRAINIQVISTFGRSRSAVLIEAAYTELAVRALHAAYGLDQL